MANNGHEYEYFVAKLQQALLNAENYVHQKNIIVEIDKKIIDNCGVLRQFDIYWEYELGGLTYKTIIECKDYNSKISIEKIDALIGKIKDLPDLKAVFATKTGYQSGAETKALQNKIELLVVREQNDSDWTSADGTPLIKIINIQFQIQMPAKITKFEPLIDKTWLEGSGVNLNEIQQVGGLTNELIIDDVGRAEKYSVYELESKLSPIGGADFGDFKKEITFEEAYFHHQSLKLKIAALKIEYSIPNPINSSFENDFSKELIGVIEYLQKGIKKSVFKNGLIKSDH